MSTIVFWLRPSLLFSIGRSGGSSLCQVFDKGVRSRCTYFFFVPWDSLHWSHDSGRRGFLLSAQLYDLKVLSFIQIYDLNFVYVAITDTAPFQIFMYTRTVSNLWTCQSVMATQSLNTSINSKTKCKKFIFLLIILFLFFVSRSFIYQSLFITGQQKRVDVKCRICIRLFHK